MITDIAAVVDSAAQPILTQPAVPALEASGGQPGGRRYAVAVGRAATRAPHCLPGARARAGGSALDLADHLCGLGKLRPLLRRHGGLCRH